MQPCCGGVLLTGKSVFPETTRAPLASLRVNMVLNHDGHGSCQKGGASELLPGIPVPMPIRSEVMRAKEKKDAMSRSNKRCCIAKTPEDLLCGSRL